MYRSYRSYGYSRQSEYSTCGCCGTRTTRSLHGTFFPECSSSCVEWVVDRNQEEKGGFYWEDDR